MKEIDRKPFPVEVVAHSEMFEDAFQAEQCIHLDYGKYRLNGEWFEIPPDEVDYLIKTIEFASGFYWDRKDHENSHS